MSSARIEFGVNCQSKERLLAAAMNEKDRRLSVRIAFCLEEGVIG